MNLFPILLACLPWAATEPPPTAPIGWSNSYPQYYIDAPDVLLIEMIQDPLAPVPSITGRHLVRADGTIDLGVFGSASVAGKTIEEAADAIASRLKAEGAAKNLTTEQIRRHLSVDIAEYNSKVYFVITRLGGQEPRIDKFPLIGCDTVLDAVALIPGLPAIASRYMIWVERPDVDLGKPPQLLLVDWRRITMGECSDRTNYVLRNGDRVHVEPNLLVMEWCLDQIVSVGKRWGR